MKQYAYKAAKAFLGMEMQRGNIGKYRLGDVIGSGAHGNLTKATDPSLDRIVAIKSLKLPSNGEDNPAFLREARLLAKLSHPNIVTIFEILEYDNENHLIMEYVDGTTLSDILDDGPPDLETAKKICKQLAEAVGYAHQEGIVHGDLKPANILLTKEGDVRLADFGLANLISPVDVLETIATGTNQISAFEGTMPYMSPEKVMGSPLDPQNDIFSLGAVFYEILTGERAFVATEKTSILNQILNHTPAPIHALSPQTPEWLTQLVDAMLEKDPINRISSMHDVNCRLQNERPQNLLEKFNSRKNSSAASKAKLSTIYKTGAAMVVIASIGWATVNFTDVLEQPVSTRMANGLELVKQVGIQNSGSQARELFTSILSKDPKHAGANAGLSLALIRQYTSEESDPAIFKRAKGLAAQALVSDPQLALSNIASGWVSEFEGDFDSAHKYFRSANILAPDNALTLEGQFRTYRKERNFNAAKAVLEKANMIYPKEDLFFAYHGDMLARRGKLPEAEKMFRKALDLEPDNASNYASLAQTLHLQGNTTKAVATIQDGLKIHQSANLYNNLGTYLFFQGQYEQATKAFERTLDFDGNSHVYIYWANLADAYSLVPDKSDEAKKAYKRAVQLVQNILTKRPLDKSLNSRVAMYSAKAGDRKIAEAALSISLKEPVSEPAIYFRAATSYEVLGKRKLALAMIRKSLSKDYPLSEIENSPDFSKLRQDPDYHLIIVDLKG